MTELDILQNKIDAKLGENHINVKTAINQFKTLSENISDSVVILTPDNYIPFHVNGRVSMLHPTSGNQYVVHEHALRQFSERYDIKYPVLKEYISGPEWQKILAQNILNAHSHNMPPGKYLMRFVGDELRGFLSSNYKRFNSADIIGTFLTQGQAIGLVPYSAYISDTKIWFESIIPKVFQIPSELNKTIYICFGARASISDFGDGAYNLQTYILNVICMNGATAENKLKSVHRGGEISTDIQISEETHRIETLAKVSLTRDVLNTLFDGPKLQEHAAMIKRAASISLDAQRFMSERLPKMNILAEEIKKLEEVFLTNKADDGLYGEMSLWKMAQGISAVGRDLPERRKRELDDLAGKILLLS